MHIDNKTYNAEDVPAAQGEGPLLLELILESNIPHGEGSE